MDDYFERGIAALEAADYHQAVDALTRAYRLSLGDLAEVLLYRGMAFAYLGEEERALEDFNESLQRNPYRADAYNERGTLFRLRGDHTAAVRDYSNALAIDPALYEAAYHRALAYEALNETTAAEADLTRALELNPDITTAYELRGRLRAARNEYDGAISDFERYLRLGGGREYDNQSEVQSYLLSLRVQRLVLRLFRLV